MANPIASMTGFARTEGAHGGAGWIWELRSVNGRGLDVRFRLPPGWDSAEPALREELGKSIRRGNVSATLTVAREQQSRLALDEAALEQALERALALHRRIPGSPPPRAESLLALPGVLRQAAADPAADKDAASEAARAGFSAALAALAASRAQEGERLGEVVGGLIDEIAELRARATREARDQPAMQRARMLETVKKLLAELPALPEERIAQEVALLASKSDIREELDRLASHVAAARALLREGANIGRKLEFLIQEFNREANTLCSKSASEALTATGLAMKAAIERLREQAANIE